MSNKESLLKKLFDSVLEGNLDDASIAARESIEAGIPPLTAVEEGLTAGIREVGERFERGEMFLPEMVSSAEAMEAALSILEPHLKEDAFQNKGKVLIGTVQGDIHDIGKNIVICLLKVNGYEVIDLGRDTPSTEFIDKAVESEVKIVCLSGLLSTSMPTMRDIIQMMCDDGVRDKFKVLIGGGPTSQDYADRIGADGYGETAHRAVQLCDGLLGFSNR